jgi:arylsulfatase
MLGYLRGESDRIHDEEEAFGFEAYGSRAIRQGQWKISWTWPPYGPGRWELFDMSNDPAEQHDLSDEMPARLAALVTAWDRYVEDNGIWVFDRDMGYGR